MRAVVLVGGEGTRLRPLTFTTPKQLLPIAEMPMIERVLGGLARHGIDDVVLSLGYRPDAFAAAYPQSRAAGVGLSYAVEATPLDTAGAIRFAARSAGIDETFIVVNGDVLTDADIGAFVDFHRSRDAWASVLLTPVDDPSRYGVVETGDDGRVLRFIEKPPADSAPTNLINAGIYVFEPSVLDAIPDGRRVSVERETFPQLVERGVLYAAEDDAYWLDTGTPEAFLQAGRDILAGRRTATGDAGAAPPAPGAVRRAGTWVIGEAAVDGDVDAISLVGAGASVHAGAVVRSSVVGSGCSVGDGASVSGSVLLPGAQLLAGATVCDSIVGRRSIIGEGASVEAVSIIGDDVVLERGTSVSAARVPAVVTA